MRLLVLNLYFHPDVAATGQLLTELCVDLARRHEVEVIAGFPTYNPLESRPERPSTPRTRRGVLEKICTREVYEGVHVRRVFTWRGSRTAFASRLATYVTFLVSAVVAGFCARRPDVVMTWTDPPLIPLVGWMIAALRRRPLVIVIQDIYPEVAVHVGALRAQRVVRILRKLLDLPLRRAARLVVISAGMRQRVCDRGISPDKIAVIPNWADGQAIAPGEKENPFSRAHGLDRDLVVLHAGNIGLTQDFDVLLRCAERFRDVPHVRFLLVGDGARGEYVREEARRRRLTNVLFLPYQPKERLKDVLATGDVAVITLRPGLEGYVEPSKVYAIMASGRPFVAAIGPESEVARLAREHTCGRIVPSGCSEALADALRALLSDPEERQRLGRNGRAALVRFYERARAVQQYEELLGEVCRREDRGRPDSARGSRHHGAPAGPLRRRVSGEDAP